MPNGPVQIHQELFLEEQNINCAFFDEERLNVVTKDAVLFSGCTGVVCEKESVGPCSVLGIKNGCKDSCEHTD